MNRIQISYLLSKHPDLLGPMNAAGQALVEEYAARWTAGERWPAIRIAADGAIEDGTHRIRAAILLGHVDIERETN